MNRLTSRRLSAILSCLTILAIFGTISFPAVASATASDAELLALTQNTTVVAFKPSGTSSSPNSIAVVTDSTETRLLVVLSKYNSIDELNNPARIGLGSDNEIPWLQAALNSYGIECFPIIVPESDTYNALIRGVVDAVLVTAHPSPSLQTGIESGEFRLVPWSEEAVAAVVEVYPNSVIPAQLPANTYAGQSDAILGYAYLPPITLTEDFTLTSDMTFSDTGFIIGADDITLNLNGHTIIGISPLPIPPGTDPVTTEVGVRLGEHTGVTVKNGTIKGFQVGINLIGADNNIIKGIVATRNSWGLSLYGSNNNLIKSNAISNNTPAGIMLNDSDSNTITGNTIEGNGAAGIVIATEADNNEIRDNRISNNGLNGIRLGASPVDPPGAPPANNPIDGNTIEENGRNGIIITNGAHDNEIGNNTIKGNGLIGIFVGAAPPPGPLPPPPPGPLPPPPPEPPVDPR